jgi:hypothetical protein
VLIDDFQPDLVGYWEVVQNGIYFVDAETSPYPTLQFFAFAPGRTSPVAMLAGHIVPWAGSLPVSPDQRSILYTQRMYERSGIILVENFR